MSIGCVKCHVCPYIDTRADRKCVSLDTLLGDLIEHNFMRSNSKDRSKEERARLLQVTKEHLDQEYDHHGHTKESNMESDERSAGEL